MAKKATNKELQNDIIKLYDSTKRGLDSLLFTLWEYIKWKGDGDDFKKFCDNMNNQVKESLDDKKADGGKD